MQLRLEKLGAGPVAAICRCHDCAEYGRPALRLKVQNGVAVRPNDVTPS